MQSWYPSKFPSVSGSAHTLKSLSIPPFFVWLGKVYEMNKYYSFTKHMNEPGILVLSKKFYDKLPEDLFIPPDALEVFLETFQGPLDLLCQLHDGRTYADLVPHTVEMSDGTVHLRVLDLPTLIAVKSATGRARDQLVVPILVALRRELEEE